MKVIFALFSYHVTLIASGLYGRLVCCTSDFCENFSIWLDVSLIGLSGCCAYCMRALYLQYCVKKEWDNRWIVWHIIRPFVGTICGVVSLLFVKAGLLIFEASSVEASNRYGIYALAFIAGFNVGNFLKKIDSLFKEITGIQETRASGEK